MSEVSTYITVTAVQRARNRKWRMRLELSDKILKLRAFVQEKTMLPLSRIELTWRGELLWDRHTAAQSNLIDDAVVEIIERATAL